MSDHSLALVPDPIRLAALDAYAILDTPPEKGFDDIVLLARMLCAAPVALVSLVARDRQWFKARSGFEPHQTDLDASVCAHGLGRSDLLVIPDLTQDPRTRDNPLVTGEPGIRFYAGAPLHTPEGLSLGSLCVIDTVPRSDGLTPEQAEGLRALAGQVMVQLELRRALVERDVVLHRRREDEVALRGTEASAREDAARVQLALAAGAIIGTWFWDLPTDHFTVDEAFARAFGLDPALGREGLSLEEVIATVHPDDRPGLIAAINDAVARGGAYAQQYRVRRADGRYHWIEANGRVDLAPDGTGLSFPGVLIDVEQRRAEGMLAELAERLRTLATPQAMALAAAETVGLALSLSRAAYGDVDEPGQHIVIAQDWLASGQRSAAGGHSFADYGSYIEALRRGVDVTVADVAADPRTAGQVESFRALDIGSLANLPLIERGHLKVVFCLHRDRAQAWSADELSFARRVMNRTEVEIARRSVSGQLRDSEARYRTLFESIDVGFCIVELRFDEAGTPTDYRFVEVNPAFERQTGLKDAAGRWMRDLAPGHEQHWFDIYGQVALTGEAAHFENKADVFGRWFDVRALRVGDPADHRVAILFNDISDRKDNGGSAPPVEATRSNSRCISARRSATGCGATRRTFSSSLTAKGRLPSRQSSLHCNTRLDIRRRNRTTSLRVRDP